MFPSSGSAVAKVTVILLWGLAHFLLSRHEGTSLRMHRASVPLEDQKYLSAGFSNTASHCPELRVQKLSRSSSPLPLAAPVPAAISRALLRHRHTSGARRGRCAKARMPCQPENSSSSETNVSAHAPVPRLILCVRRLARGVVGEARWRLLSVTLGFLAAFCCQGQVSVTAARKWCRLLGRLSALSSTAQAATGLGMSVSSAALCGCSARCRADPRLSTTVFSLRRSPRRNEGAN